MSKQSNRNDAHDRSSPINTTTNDIAIFLDLDNLVIGAKQANLTFDINLVLRYIKELTNGRIVLRRSYGDWRQSQQLMKDLAVAGFAAQSTIRINSFSKNLADMQIVVDTMDTLIDGHQYSTYVLMTGDRDFTPLVQSLRKRGKHVIGVGVKHTASQSFVSLCDQYIYYEDIIPTPQLNDRQVEDLLVKSMNTLLANEKRVRASILKQQMSDDSNGAFDKSQYAEGSFRKFLESHSHIVDVEQVNTTLYVQRPQQNKEVRPLHLRYRTLLKKQKLRVVETDKRFTILKDIIEALQSDEQIRWRELIDHLADKYDEADKDISKNKINAVLLLARQADVLNTLKGKSLSTAPVLLALKGEKLFQTAVMRCDATYLKEILGLPETFVMEEVALALYYTKKHIPYLERLMKQIDRVVPKA